MELQPGSSQQTAPSTLLTRLVQLVQLEWLVESLAWFLRRRAHKALTVLLALTNASRVFLDSTVLHQGQESL